MTAGLPVFGDDHILVESTRSYMGHTYPKMISEFWITDNRNYGNLRYNTDANYAIYSEIEGLALEKAYLEADDQKAKEFLKDFIMAREYMQPVSRGETYSLGLIHIYPEGIEKIQIQDVILEGKNTPIVRDRLYYIKWIDTEAGPTKKSYQLSYSKKEGENIYIDAVFTTKGFVLKAPKIQVKDRPSRVKVTILSKVNVK